MLSSERYHNISGSFATTAGRVAYGCAPRSVPVRCPPSRQGHRVAARCSPARNTSERHCAPHRQGKVRDIFDVGDALLIVATDRISAFDYVLGSGIPDKGKVLTQLSAFWFERTRAHRAEPPADARTSATYPADAARPRRRARAAGRCSCARPTRCRSNAWRAATCRDRAGRNTRRPARSAASRCRRACANRIGCPSRSSRRPPRPTSGHDINISEAEAGRSSATTLVATLRELTLALYALRRGARRVARHHPRRHQVRVRSHRRRATSSSSTK